MYVESTLKLVKRLENKRREEREGVSWGYLVWRRGDRDLIAIYSYLKEGCIEEVVHLFSQVTGGRT